MPIVKVTAKANPLLNGSITGTGSITVGATMTLTATPYKQKYFADWLLPNNTRSTANPLVIITDGDEAGEYTANFLRYYSVKVVQTGGGSATPTILQVKTTDVVTLVATPLSGFKFNGWYENGNLVSKSISYVFSGYTDRVLVPQFSNIETDTQLVTKFSIPTGDPYITDTVSASLIYRGWKAGNTNLIKKTTVVASVSTDTWAQGAWADRTTLTYL